MSLSLFLLLLHLFPFLTHVTEITPVHVYICLTHRCQPPSDPSAAANLIQSQHPRPCHIAPPTYAHPTLSFTAATFAIPTPLAPLHIASSHPSASPHTPSL